MSGKSPLGEGLNLDLPVQVIELERGDILLFPGIEYGLSPEMSTALGMVMEKLGVLAIIIPAITEPVILRGKGDGDALARS